MNQRPSQIGLISHLQFAARGKYIGITIGLHMLVPGNGVSKDITKQPMSFRCNAVITN